MFLFVLLVRGRHLRRERNFRNREEDEEEGEKWSTLRDTALLILLLSSSSSSSSSSCFSQKNSTRDFFRSILSKEGKCWPEFYKYVKRRKGYRENIPAIKDCNCRLITDPIQKANSLNYNYSSVFSNEGNTQHIQCANSGLLFTIDTKIIRKRVGAIGKKTNQ
jgi:hypothetical protein